MRPWRVKMVTQNLLRLLLLLILMLSLVQTWKLKFGHKVKFLFRLWAQGLFNILKFRRDFEAEAWSVFCCRCLVEVIIMKSNLGRDSEARVGQDFEVKFSRNADVAWDFEVDSEHEIWSRVLFELLSWPKEVTLVNRTQPLGPLCLLQCLNITLAFCITSGASMAKVIMAQPCYCTITDLRTKWEA